MIPLCLILCIIRYRSRVKWSNPVEGVAPSLSPKCSSYWNGSLWVTLKYCRQLYFKSYKVSSNSNNAITFTFRLIPLGKLWTSLSLCQAMGQIVSLLFFLQGWLWHQITHKGWYAIKTKRPNFVKLKHFKIIVKKGC